MIKSIEWGPSVLTSLCTCTTDEGTHAPNHSFPITLSFTHTDNVKYHVTVDAGDIREIRERRDIMQPGSPVVGSTLYYKSSDSAVLVVNERREDIVSMIAGKTAKDAPEAAQDGSRASKKKDEPKK